MTLLTLALLLMLNGCAPAGDADNHAQTARPLGQAKTVIHYYDSTDSTQIAHAVVAAFNAQSEDTQVELHLIDNEVYDNHIAQMLREGEENLDCLYIRQPSQVNQFSSEGLLVDLTNAVAGSGLDPASYGQTLDIIAVADTIPALPRTKSVWLLFYNRDLFAKLGIAEPGNLTWEQYAALTKRLTSVQADGSILYGGYIPPWTMNIGGAQAGEYLYDDELPHTQRYVQLLNRLYNEDQSHPDMALMEGDYSLPNNVFLDQKIATMINGDWVIYLFNNAFPEQSKAFRWGIAPLPVFENMPKGTSIGSSSYLAINRNSEHQASAFAFISFFAGNSAADMLADLSTCPSYYTEQSAERYQRNAGVPGSRYVFDSFVRNEEGAFSRYRELNILFKACMTDYLKGNVTLQAAFDAFEQQRLPVLSGE